MEQAIGVAQGNLLVTFLQAYALVLAVPGSNFLIVAEAGMGGSRRSALAAALGIGCGATLLALIALGGSSVLHDEPVIVRLASTLFALLLAKMGFDALRRAASWGGVAKRLPVGAGLQAAGAFRRGFASALSNPMTLVFFATAFGALAGGRGQGATPAALVFLLASGWFAVLGLAFSLPPVRAVYLRGRAPIDAVLGLSLIAMALRTLFNQYGLA